MTSQWRLQSLTFGCLRAFFSDWTADEPVGAHAILGVPTYLA